MLQAHAKPGRGRDSQRSLAPQVLGALVRKSGDVAAAEDAIQEALVAAASHWPREGVPPRDAAGSTRRLIDQRRTAGSRA
jgi:predicted RNA polymerase sigma factor